MIEKEPFQTRVSFKAQTALDAGTMDKVTGGGRDVAACLMPTNILGHFGAKKSKTYKFICIYQIFVVPLR